MTLQFSLDLILFDCLYFLKAHSNHNTWTVKHLCVNYKIEKKNTQINKQNIAMERYYNIVRQDLIPLQVLTTDIHKNIFEFCIHVHILFLAVV